LAYNRLFIEDLMETSGKYRGALRATYWNGYTFFGGRMAEGVPPPRKKAERSIGSTEN